MELEPLAIVKIRKDKKELLININSAKSVLQGYNAVAIYKKENSLELIPIQQFKES